MKNKKEKERKEWNYKGKITKLTDTKGERKRKGGRSIIPANIKKYYRTTVLQELYFLDETGHDHGVRTVLLFTPVHSDNNSNPFFPADYNHSQHHANNT